MRVLQIEAAASRKIRIQALTTYRRATLLMPQTSMYWAHTNMPSFAKESLTPPKKTSVTPQLGAGYFPVLLPMPLAYCLAVVDYDQSWVAS
mmetsp:Transcript_116735/g.238809  ORF Transcript_116735/g.238809 Transcript_116735/m.238809 type:complete len:91 (+) Transcript_116735:3143-3415(+)